MFGSIAFPSLDFFRPCNENCSGFLFPVWIILCVWWGGVGLKQGLANSGWSQYMSTRLALTEIHQPLPPEC